MGPAANKGYLMGDDGLVSDKRSRFNIEVTGVDFKVDVWNDGQGENGTVYKVAFVFQGTVEQNSAANTAIVKGKFVPTLAFVPACIAIAALEALFIWVCIYLGLWYSMLLAIVLPLIVAYRYLWLQKITTRFLKDLLQVE
jgi:hypothetical protein